MTVKSLADVIKQCRAFRLILLNLIVTSQN